MMMVTRTKDARLTISLSFKSRRGEYSITLLDNLRSQLSIKIFAKTCSSYKYSPSRFNCELQDKINDDGDELVLLFADLIANDDADDADVDGNGGFYWVAPCLSH